MQSVFAGVLTNFIFIRPKSDNLLLILHGWGHNSSLWSDFANLLPDNWGILIPDLPSFGGTQPLPNNPDVIAYSNFIRSLLEKQTHPYKQVVVLGHSFGGQIAIELALDHSPFNQLLLLAPACIRQSSKSKSTIFINLLSFLSKKFPPTISSFFSRLLASSDYSNSTPTQKQILSRIIRQDYSNKLKNIKTKTHLLWGSEDRALPYQAKLIASRIPDCQLTVLYGMGHNPHITHTQKLAKIISHILNDTAST